MDPREELQPFLKLVSALLFIVAGIAGLIKQEVMAGRFGDTWLVGAPAIVFASFVLLTGLAIGASWVKDRGWFGRPSG